MQHFRSSLTRLKSMMEKRLPEGNDIYGYPGISKSMLVTAIDTAYILSHEIDEKDGETRFEVIALKRAGSDAYQYMKDFLDQKSSDKKTTEEFNNFLNCLSALIEKTKMVYFITAKNGLKDDVELASIRKQIEDLKTSCRDLSLLKKELETDSKAVKGSIEVIQNRHTAAGTLTEQLTVWHTSCEQMYGEMTKSHNAISGWDKDIQSHESQFKTITNKNIVLQKDIVTLKATFESIQKQTEASASALEEYEKENQSLQKEIRETLEDANRIGMAASFKERKEELGKPQIAWQIVFLIAIVGIVLVAYLLVIPEIIKQTRDWNRILGEAAIISPLIWLGWFAAKQYSYISKIREDYAFKFAAAMSYEGHKKATREVDSDLEKVLLEFSLFNLSQNPIRLYSKESDHGMPIHELASIIMEKLPRFGKAAGQAPNISRFATETTNARPNLHDI